MIHIHGHVSCELERHEGAMIIFKMTEEADGEETIRGVEILLWFSEMSQWL